MQLAPTESHLEVVRHLAAAGQHQAALALIEQRGDPLPLPLRMLQGKILAQLGRYSAAIEAWQKVLAAQPDHRPARQAIERARNAARPWIGPFYYYSLAAWSGVVLAPLAAIGIGAWAYNATAQSREASTEASSPNGQVNAEINGRLQRLEAALASLQPQTAKPPAVPLDQSGISKQLGQLHNQMQSLDAKLQAVQQQAAALNGSLGAMGERVVAVAEKVNSQSADEPPESAKPPSLEEFKNLSAEVIRWRRDQLGWRLDVLMHRERSITGPDAARRRQSLVLEVAFLANQLSEMPLDDHWRSYLTSIQAWIEARHAREGLPPSR